jgi:hypothetical protein
MATLSIRRIVLCSFGQLILCLLAFPSVASAQRRPTIIEPKARTDSSSVRPIKAAPPTKGVLVVLFDPEVAGKITVETLAGKVVEEANADESGRADLVLKRGQAYRVKGSAPGFISDERKSKILKTTDTVLLKLTAKSATVTLLDLPAGAQVFIDSQEQPRAIADKSGTLSITDLEPGKHNLTIKHPEYRDFQYDLQELKAGSTMIFPVTLDKVAKLTIQSRPGAIVMIDGAVYGKIQDAGKVAIDYELSQISEHTITVELLGYQTSSKKELLAPGPRTITVNLDPIVTSAGVSDRFENLSLWKAPPSWQILSDTRNKKLEVKGEQLGLLSDKIYRDFVAVFTIWLSDGKGASWAVRADKDGRNYYLFHLAGPNSTSHTPRNFYTYLVKDGGTPIEVSTPFPVLVDLNQKDSYTITVIVEGHRIRHSIISDQTADKSDLGIWTDTTTSKEKFLYGSFGFRALSGEVFYVDDLTLSLDLEPFKEQ